MLLRPAPAVHSCCAGAADVLPSKLDVALAAYCHTSTFPLHRGWGTYRWTSAQDGSTSCSSILCGRRWGRQQAAARRASDAALCLILTLSSRMSGWAQQSRRHCTSWLELMCEQRKDEAPGGSCLVDGKARRQATLDRHRKHALWSMALYVHPTRSGAGVACRQQQQLRKLRQSHAAQLVTCRSSGR